ncbi:MAG: TonB-dependent receptor, partial [Cetobacterium sp.]
AENFEISVVEVPRNITIITREDMERRGVKDVEEALKVVPNLQVIRSMGDASFSLRGQSPSKASVNTLVLVNGSGIGTPDTGSYNLSLIPVDKIEKIEVIPSGGSVLYGEGGTGGVINIVVKEPYAKKNYGSLAVEAGSYNLRGYQVNYGTEITNNLLFDMTYLDKKMDGYRHHQSNDMQYIETNVKYLLKDDGYLEFGYSNSRNDKKIPGDLTEEELEDDRRQSTSDTESTDKVDIYRFTMKNKLAKNLEFMLFGDYKDRHYTSQTTNRKTEVFYVKPQVKYTYLDDSYVIVGGDFLDGETKVKKRDKKTKKVTGDENTTKDSYGGFVLNKLDFGDIQLIQGYRKQEIKYDSKNLLKNTEDKNSFNEDVFEIAANYLLNDASSVYVNYSTAFRAPSASEAGRWLQTQTLKPQTNRTIETGGKFGWNNFYLSGALFNIETENEIFYDPDPDYGGKNYNLPGKTSRKGIEITMEQFFNKLTLRESFGYIHTDIKSGKYKGNEIAGVPKYNYNIEAMYEVIPNCTITTSFYYYGSSYSANDFNNELGKDSGHTELDLALNYKFNDGFAIFGGVRNLLDEKYSDYIRATYSKSKGWDKAYNPAPERNFYAGVKYAF